MFLLAWGPALCLSGWRMTAGSQTPPAKWMDLAERERVGGVGVGVGGWILSQTYRNSELDLKDWRGVTCSKHVLVIAVSLCDVWKGILAFPTAPPGVHFLSQLLATSSDICTAERQPGRQNRGDSGPLFYYSVISEIIQWRFEEMLVPFEYSGPGLGCCASAAAGFI